MSPNSNFQRYTHYLSSLITQELFTHDQKYLEKLFSQHNVSIPKPISRSAVLFTQAHLIKETHALTFHHRVDFNELSLIKNEDGEILRLANGTETKVGSDGLSDIDECIAIAGHTDGIVGVKYNRIKFGEDDIQSQHKLASLHRLLKNGPKRDIIDDLLLTNNWKALPRKVNPLRHETFDCHFFIATARNAVMDTTHLFNAEELIIVTSSNTQYTSSLMAEALANDISDQSSIY